MVVVTHNPLRIKDNCTPWCTATALTDRMKNSLNDVVVLKAALHYRDHRAAGKIGIDKLAGKLRWNAEGILRDEIAGHELVKSAPHRQKRSKRQRAGPTN